MTYSIIARDPVTGEMGVAVQTHTIQVGTLVPWARAGVGAVAAQSRGPGPGGHGRGPVELRYGPKGLDLMEAGYTPEQALHALRAIDEFGEWRQVAMVDATGRVAAHTGARCVQAAGHRSGDGYSAQANMMSSAAVWTAIAEGYEHASGPLAERLVAALDAGQRAGGDIRGQQSAAVVVVAAGASGQPWLDRTIDLRVDDHTEPVVELRRLLRLKRAYAALEQSSEALGRGASVQARQLREEAVSLAPEKTELRFWAALDAALVDKDEALRLLSGVVAEDDRWLRYMQRLAESGWLDADLARELQRGVLRR